MSVPVKLVIESLIGVGACNQLSADHPGLYSELTVKETEAAPALESMSSGGEAVDGQEKGQVENQAASAAVVVVASQESSSGGVATVDSAEASGVPGGCFQKVADDSFVDSSYCTVDR